MNKLTLEKRVQIISMLVEGNSLRATSRVTGTSINTVTKLLVEVGKVAEEFHNTQVRAIESTKLQIDEIWSFVYAKQRRLPEDKEGMGGDVWTWTALDADSKLIVSWLVSGVRTARVAQDFIQDVRDRVKTFRPQISTDGLPLYRDAIDQVFGNDVDYAQIVKRYGANPNTPFSKYGVSECIGTEKTIMTGDPNPDHISTSYVERQNLTMRMSMRRFTRATNGFSKKMENHWLAIALHFFFYNFVRVHKTLRVTPAMQAGITKKPLKIEDLIRLTDQSGK
jgi:IS1 family transposase